MRYEDTLTIMEFVNAARRLLALPPVDRLPLMSTEQDDEDCCIVAAALGVPVGASAHADWSAADTWVMRVPDAGVAARLGERLGLAWRSAPAEVALPSELVDLAVSYHFAAVEGDADGALTAWSVLDATTCEWERWTPGCRISTPLAAPAAAAT